MSIDEKPTCWLEIRRHQRDGQRTLVAEHDGNGRRRVVGFASFGPYRLDTGDDKTMDTSQLAEPGTTGELYGFYVHPDLWGSGDATR